ncbi:MAG: GNAT family N-acetyltransferase [Candidatus Hodarchaeota archaeon]
MEISIRKATINDAKAISKIWEIICSEGIYSAVSKPFTVNQESDYIRNLSDREAVFLAFSKNQLIGFQTLDEWSKITDSFNHVGTIGTFIRPEFRGKGIGKELTEVTIEFAKEKDYEKFIVYIRATNISAQNFYRSLGFVTRGILTNQVKINGIYDDEIFMEYFIEF